MTNTIRKRPTLRALALCTTAALSMTQFGWTEMAYAQAQSAEVTLSIPAQNLGSALTQLADQSGIRLILSSQIVAGKRSPALNGSYTARSAFAALLSGSGLSYRFTSANTVTVYATNDSAAVDLPEGTLLLDTIIVSGGTGSYSANSNYEEPASIVYKDAEEIERFRGTSVGDFLKGAAGVLNGDNRNSGALDVNVRGMQGQGRVPVVIDGSFQETTVYRGYSGIAGRTYLDPDLIGSMSIEKGPSSGADANGATGGVMRVSTLKPDDIIKDGDTQGVRLTFGVTSNTTDVPETFTIGAGQGDEERYDRPGALEFGDSWNGSIAVAQKFGDFELLAATARRKTGNYFAGDDGDDPADDSLNQFVPGEEVLNTSQDNTSHLLRGIYKWGNGHSIDASYMHYESDFGELMPSQIIRFGMGWQSPLSYVDAKTGTLRYGWNPDDNDLIDLEADLYYTLNTTSINTAYGFMAGFPGVYFSYASEAEQFGLNVSNTSRLDLFDRALTLNYGVAGKKEYIRPPSDIESYIPDDYPYVEFDGEIRDGWRQEVSAFVSAHYELSNTLTFDGSLRYSEMKSYDNNTRTIYVDDGNGGQTRTEVHTEYDGGGLAPIASLTYEAIPGLQVYGKYAEAYRAPSLFESTVGWSASPDPTLDLKPEHAQNKEIGVNYMTDQFGAQIRAKLAYFDNDIENYITRDDSWNFVNLDSARMKGWELSLGFDTGRFYGDFSGSKYVSTEFCDLEGACSSGGSDNGYVQQHVPPETSASLTLGGRFLDETLELGGRVTYVGKRASSDFSGPRGGTTRAVDWDPYTTVDLFGSYEINDTLTFDFAVDNVTDQYYMDTLTIGLMPSPGRTVRLGLTATF
ncbi:TonB-dependent receptor [Celeribacter naphthalenivorans]|uniref:TonB-dependent receptor n=1 Tax=Celeribacter naphthalenivorans TaxID=1614694 RepID=UPI001CF9F596|nr:TonB-dependent receptor [Celeribacter naphthalenivorans]